MASHSLVISRDYDLPRVIVWDAFVDQDLIDGWLPPGSMTGEVTVLEPLDRIAIESGADILEFALSEIPTGTRGTGTTVTVTVTGEGDDTARVTTDWRRNLDQLEELLRGHPVDWDARARAGEDAAHNAADGA